MPKKVKPIPEGYHTVTPYLIFDDAAGAIEFYKKAFGAKESGRFEDKGRIMHAEIIIGDSHIMLADANPQRKALSPKTIGGSPISLMVYVDNVDTFFRQAINAGATAVMPVDDKFYGDRSGTLIDPYGYTWTIGTHVEDVTMEQMQERMSAGVTG